MAIKDIHENYQEYKEERHFRAFLYSPAGIFQKEIEMIAPSIRFVKRGYHTLDFQLPAKIFNIENLENEDNDLINYMLTGYHIEVWMGDLSDDNLYEKYNFIITSSPSSLSGEKPVFKYSALSAEYELQQIPIINWPGIEVMSYKQITGIDDYPSNVNEGDISEAYQADIVLNKTPIEGTIIVSRINTTYGVEIPLIKTQMDNISDISENEYAVYEGTDNKIHIVAWVPSNTGFRTENLGPIQWNDPVDKYQYYIYYETEDIVSSSDIIEGEFEESPYFLQDGLTVNEVINDLFTNVNENFLEWTADTTTYPIDTIRSGLNFSNTNVRDLLESLVENYDVHIEYDTFNRHLTVMTHDDFRQKRGLRFEYGKYLKGINQEYTIDEMVNYIQGQDANSIGFADVSWSGDNYIENYDYYLDGATWTKESGLSGESRWLTTELTTELARIKYYQEHYNEEVWGSDTLEGIANVRYRLQEDKVEKETEIIEVEDKIFLYDGLIENYNALTSLPEDQEIKNNLDLGTRTTLHPVSVDLPNWTSKETVEDLNITILNEINTTQSLTKIINSGSTYHLSGFKLNGIVPSALIRELLVWSDIRVTFRNNGSITHTTNLTIQDINKFFLIGSWIYADQIDITLRLKSKNLKASLLTVAIESIDIMYDSGEIYHNTFLERQEYLKAIAVAKKSQLEREIAAIDVYPSNIEFNESVDSPDESQLGIAQIEARLAYIAENYTSVNYNNLTEASIRELKRIRRGGVYQNNDIIDSTTLFKAAQDYILEHNYPTITVSISSISLLQAYEAYSDWQKVKLGELVDIYVPQLKISVEAEIQEISINLQNYSMALVISTVQNYDKSFGKYFAETYKLLNQSVDDIIIPNETPNAETAEWVDSNYENIEDLTSGGESYVGFPSEDQDFLSNATLETVNVYINPITETLTTTPPVLETADGPYYVYGEADPGSLKITNGGLYIKDENEKNVISLTSRNGLIGTNTDGDITFHLDMEGDAKFAGDVSGSTGTFGDASDETNFVIKLGDTTSPLIISTTEATPNIMAQFDATGDFSLAGQNIVWDQNLETLSILGDLNLETFVQYTDVNYTSVNVSLDISNFIEVTIIDHPAIAEEDAPDTIGLKLNLASVNTTTKELTINITDLDDVSLGSITIGLTQYLNFDSYTITNETTHAISGWQFTIDDGGTKAGYSVNNIVNSVVTLSYHMKNDVNDILDYLLSHLGVSTSINADLLNGYSSGDFVLKEGDSMTGSLDIDGDLTITGDIIQQGAAYETHAEHIYTTQDKIYLRDGATTGLLAGETVGLIAVNADGSNNAELVFNGDGVARVGDSGSTQAIATREDTPTTNAIPYWNNTLNRLDSTDIIWDETNKRLGVVSPTSTFTVNNNSKFNYSLTVDGKTYLKDNLYLDPNNVTDNSHSIIMSYNDLESAVQTAVYVDSLGDLRFDNGTANKVYHDGNFSVSVGTTTTGAAGTNASVANSGTGDNLILDFTIPKGDKGDTGDTGDAATISVGTTTTGDAGTNASVTNSGTTSTAVFNFTIPRGVDGISFIWEGAWSSSATYSENDVVLYNGSSYIGLTDNITGSLTPETDGRWQLMASKGDTGSDANVTKTNVDSALGIATADDTYFYRGDGSWAEESDPVFTASAASGITATDISNWNAAEANVQSDWNATSGDAFILNKPDLSNYLTTSTGKKSYTWEAPIVYNTFRNIAKSVGPDLSTGGILYAEGTSGSVVINARFEILVNHSQDIMINSISTGYTQCSLRIQSDSNENMNLLFTREHDDTNETTVRFTYIPYVDEVEFTPYDNNPSPSYSTIALTHTTKFFGTNISSTGGSASRKYIEGVEIAVTTDIPSVSGLLKIDGSNAMNDDLPIVAQGIEADSDSYGIEFRFVDSNIDPQAKTLYTASDGTLIFGIEDVAMIGDIPTNNNELTNGAGYTTNTGTVTEVTVGTGLDVSNGTTTPNITLDLSEFTDMTADVVGTEDEIILLDNGGERRKLISEIKLSQFDNDSGWTSAGVTGDAHALVSEGNPHSVTLSEVGFTGDSNANYITNNNELENGAGYITNTLSDEAGDDFTLGTNGTVSSANSNAVRFKYHATGTTTDTYKNLYVDNAGDLNFGSGVVALLSDIPSYTDTNTTYTHSWVDSGTNAILRLAAGGSGSGNDDLTIIAGDNITLTPSGDNLTIASANTTYDTFENLTDGLVPAPNEVGSTKFLRQDGTWVVPYTHPTEDGDDFSINTTNLTGSSVFSGITINVTTNTLGHVTDTSGTVSTRNIDAVRGQNGADIKFWTGTSAEYQALGSYDSNTIYYVTFN